MKVWVVYRQDFSLEFGGIVAVCAYEQAAERLAEADSDCGVDGPHEVDGDAAEVVRLRALLAEAGEVLHEYYDATENNFLRTRIDAAVRGEP